MGPDDLARAVVALCPDILGPTVAGEPDREHARVPLTLRVEFRTASSLLVAYSVNVSRGGLFVETEADVELGTDVTLELAVAGQAPVPAHGVVAWRRGRESPDGPPGLGVEFQDVTPALGAAIDHLVAGYRGLTVLVLASDKQDRSSLARLVRTIMSTAEVIQADDAHVAASLLTEEVDVAIVDLDFDSEGGLATVRAAKALSPPVPTVALASTEGMQALAREAGADEVGANPPPFDELQLRMVRALGRPLSVR